MKLFDQIIFGSGKGDCLRTCIAIMIGADKVEDVPNFVENIKGNEDANAFDNWWLDIQKWCILKGYLVSDYGYPNGWKPQGEELWIAFGLAERGLRHAVIMKGLELFHDPHPSRAGLLNIDRAVTVENILELLEYYHKSRCEDCSCSDYWD